MAPLISAHRGSCGVPGLPAAERYHRAIGLGVDYVELDVRRTADGRYVNYHDGVTPSGHRIGSLTFAGAQDELGPELLSLDELFDVVDGHAGLHVDLKEPGYESDIMHAILERAAVDRFVVTTGDVESIRTIREQFPSVRAGLTLGTDMKGAAAWATLTERLGEQFPGPRLKRSHAQFVAAHEQLARIRLLGYCARRRMECWVWTVDEEGEIARFMADARVTTLITNRPDIAVRLRSA
jgi:glycerophosphoryl diester phosphodiesterase